MDVPSTYGRGYIRQIGLGGPVRKFVSLHLMPTTQ